MSASTLFLFCFCLCAQGYFQLFHPQFCEYSTLKPIFKSLVLLSILWCLCGLCDLVGHLASSFECRIWKLTFSVSNLMPSEPSLTCTASTSSPAVGTITAQFLAAVSSSYDRLDVVVGNSGLPGGYYSVCLDFAANPAGGAFNNVSSSIILVGESP